MPMPVPVPALGGAAPARDHSPPAADRALTQEVRRADFAQLESLRHELVEMTAQRESALAQEAAERELRAKSESIHESQLREVLAREQALSRQLTAAREHGDEQLAWREKAEARAAELERIVGAVKEEAAQGERALQQVSDAECEHIFSLAR